jgi:arginase family enzyme
MMDPADRSSQLDCGDVPVIPNDPVVAIDQVRAAYSSLLSRKVVSPERMKGLGYAKGLDGEYHPRMVTLGGDHTIVSVFSVCARAKCKSESPGTAHLAKPA